MEPVGIEPRRARAEAAWRTSRAAAQALGQPERTGWLERRTKKKPAPKDDDERPRAKRTAWRSLSPELKAAWDPMRKPGGRP